MHFHDLGKLMLALVMLWAYFSFSQFLIIWAGNLPEEIPYYLERLTGGWKYAQPARWSFGHFVLPFCLLLSARPQEAAEPAGARRLVHRRDPPLRHHLAGRARPSTQAGFPISLAERRRAAGAGRRRGCSCSRGSSRKPPLLPVNDPYFKDMLAQPHHGGH